MFAARGIAVSFSVFVMVYCVLSVAVCLAWRRVWTYCQAHPVRRAADVLFTLRIFPFITATVITAAFTVPSFLLLEPRAIEEPMGEIPLAFGLFGALLGMFGIVNACLAVRKASRTLKAWTNGAEPVESSASIPVLRTSGRVPAMTATGIVRPKILLSRTSEFLLTANELKTALSHEIAHVRRRDNLKKLVLRFVSFPGMASLERAWLEATEMAADDAAVASVDEALDLAAALIKLSRLSPVEPSVDLTAALVHSPTSVMNARVERLIAWTEDRRVPAPVPSSWYGLSAAAATIGIFTLSYSHLLVRVHTATEWLVR